MSEKFGPEDQFIKSPENDAHTESSPEEIVKAEETRARVHQLESNSQEYKKQNWVSGIVSELKKRGAQIAKIGLVLGILGLSGSESKEELSQEKDHQEASQENNDQASKEAGLDLSSIAAEAGFDLKVEVQSKSGKYIVQIGQAHYVDGIEVNEELTHKVIESQKSIEKLLLALASNGNDKIFSEGVASEEGQEKAFLYGEKERKLAEEVTAGEGCFEKLAQKCDEETKAFMAKNDPAYDTIVTQIRNIFRNRAIELSQNLKADNKFSDEEKAEFEKSLESFKPFGVFSGNGEDGIYLIGAENKLQWEGAVHLLPAETEESVQDASDSVKKLLATKSAAREWLINVDFNNPPPGEGAKWKKTLDEAEKEQEFLTMDTREDIAIQKINSYVGLGYDQKIIPLIFGQDHDFRNNVEAFNQSNPDSDFGLIKLSPHVEAK